MMLGDDGLIGTLVRGAFWALLLSVPGLIVYGVYAALSGIGEQGREDREAEMEDERALQDDRRKANEKRRECRKWLDDLGSRCPQVVLDLASYAKRSDSGLVVAYNRYKAEENKSAVLEICRLIGNDIGAMISSLRCSDGPIDVQEVELLCSFRSATRSRQPDDRYWVLKNAEADITSQKELKAYPILMLMEISHPDVWHLAHLYEAFARHVAGLPAPIERKIERERILRYLLVICQTAATSVGSSRSSAAESDISDCQQCAQSWQVLGLDRSASAIEAKVAYKDLAMVWHPDRFGTDERLRNKADVKMKQINQAYAHFTEHSSK